MGTRCVIAKEQHDGSYRALFCFMDGYPTGVGDQLNRHYRDPETIDRLLDLRILNSLGKSPDNPIPAPEWQQMFRSPMIPDDLYRVTKERCVTFPGLEDDTLTYDARDGKEFRAKLSTPVEPEYAYIWGESGWVVCSLWEQREYAGAILPKMEPVSLEMVLSGMQPKML